MTPIVSTPGRDVHHGICQYAAMAKSPGFDSAYFRKYYFNTATRVTTAAEMRGRAQLIAAILRHSGIPVRRILDVGCGIGLLRRPFATALPRARYVGLETSEYLCDRYRWTKGSVVDFAPRFT